MISIIQNVSWHPFLFLMKCKCSYGHLLTIHFLIVFSESTYDVEFHQFLRSQEGLISSKAPPAIQGFTQQQVNMFSLMLAYLPVLLP